MINNLTSYFTSADFLFQLELLLRIFIALFCGAIIGHERKNRGKGAGTKTHAIVAIAACLLMILSQYGVEDFLKHYNGTGANVNLDPFRIAAQIVPGIGFLGAGMIFVQKKVITGLTTAAGIWATAGIGMAIGAGMYFISISTTLIIVVVQILFHKEFKFFSRSTDIEISLTVKNKEDALPYVNALLEENGIHAHDIESTAQTADADLFDLYINASCTDQFDKIELADKLYQNNNIISIKL